MLKRDSRHIKGDAEALKGLKPPDCDCWVRYSPLPRHASRKLRLPSRLLLFYEILLAAGRTKPSKNQTPFKNFLAAAAIYDFSSPDFSEIKDGEDKCEEEPACRQAGTHKCLAYFAASKMRQT